MKQIIIESGFYDNVEQMQILFSTLDYVKNENILGGQICPMPYANQDMLKYMQFIITGNNQDDIFEFAPGSGSFILNSETELPSLPVCVQLPDPQIAWAGVLPLNESTEPHFLKFYTNKKTGWSEIPADFQELLKEDIKSYPEFEQFLINENTNWQERWQETTRIEFKKNQLILFKPTLFHSYMDAFGNSKETSRLLQFFFLKPNSPQDLTPDA
jgi:hypothetical protein